MLWEQKKQEERDFLFRDVEELKELSRQKMFGRPGHGAPTEDIRKKKFTEHQLRRSQSVLSLDDALDGYQMNNARNARQYLVDFDPKVRQVFVTTSH